MELTEEDIVDIAINCMTDRQFQVWTLRREGYTIKQIRDLGVGKTRTLTREYSRAVGKLEDALFVESGAKDTYGVTIAYGKHARFATDTTLMKCRKVIVRMAS